MAKRRRTIQDNIWLDHEFGMLSPLAQLLWIGCITQADDEGRLNGHPLVLKGVLWPFNGVSIEDVFNALEEIQSKMSNFLYYEVEGDYYIQFNNWEKHQSLRKDRLIKSTYPRPNDNQMSTKGQPSAAKVSKEVSKEVSKATVKLKELRDELTKNGILKKTKLL